MPDAARAAELLRDVDERATVFPHRSAWAPCSLTAATDADPIGNACRLRSLLGTGATGWCGVLPPAHMHSPLNPAIVMRSPVE
jgi:hypothetical protein